MISLTLSETSNWGGARVTLFSASGVELLEFDANAQQEHTLAETVQRLGWSWDPAVLAPLAMPVSAPTRLNVALAEVDEAGQFRLHPRPPRPGDHPSEWDQDDRHTFDRYAGAAMHALGYR